MALIDYPDCNKGTVCAIFFLVAGCSYQPILLDADVTYQPWQSVQALESVRLPAMSVGGDINLCVAQNVQNRSTTLQDMAGSTVIAYGQYGGSAIAHRDEDHTRETGGGDVLLHSGNGVVVAQGTVDYQSSALVKRVVRYTLTITPKGYEFTNLEHAQVQTGAVANAGFDKIGAFAGAEPDKALAALKGVTSKIDRCRSR